MKKYYNPEEVEKVIVELRQLKTDFFSLSVAKGTSQPVAVYLDAILEDKFAELAELCEEIVLNIDDYFKNR